MGRQPAIGLAELESLYGAEHVKPIDGVALLDIEATQINFKRLGGTLKVAKLLGTLPTTSWKEAHQYLVDKIPGHLQYLPLGTFTVGLSVYGLNVEVKKLNADMLALKKIIRSSGRSVRIVPNKALELNSAQVLHNKLTHRSAWELLLIRDQNQTYLAQTLFVQDIEAYAARDQARPKRDSRVGMLPPKLAQIIINLAKPPEGGTILDPFCGTGVILQEALLMGYNAVGTDLDPRMVEYSKTNLEWLVLKLKLQSSNFKLTRADATAQKWQNFECLATETYLGRPFSAPPSSENLRQTVSDVNIITKKFLNNLAQQIPSGFRLCLAVPAWHVKNQVVHLPTIDHLTDMGYNRVDFVNVKNVDLVYFRPNQIVARELLVLEKK